MDVCPCKDICVGFHHGGRNAMSVEATHTRTVGPNTCLGNCVRCGGLIARRLVSVKCHWQGLGAGVGSLLPWRGFSGQQKRAWGQMCGFPQPSWPSQACYLSISCRASGLSSRAAPWLWASGELGACDFETWPFSVLFVQKSFILALFSGCRGLGEPWGDLAIGQLSKLCWEIWGGAISLCLISGYILLFLPKRVFTVANRTV